MLFCEKRLLHRLAGNADDLIRPQLFSHFSCFHIALSHMDAVRIHRQGNVHVVIDHKRDMILPAELFDLFCLFEESLLVQLFFSQLYKGRSAF